MQTLSPIDCRSVLYVCGALLKAFQTFMQLFKGYLGHCHGEERNECSSLRKLAKTDFPTYCWRPLGFDFGASSQRRQNVSLVQGNYKGLAFQYDAFGERFFKHGRYQHQRWNLATSIRRIQSDEKNIWAFRMGECFRNGLWFSTRSAQNSG